MYSIHHSSIEHLGPHFENYIMPSSSICLFHFNLPHFSLLEDTNLETDHKHWSMYISYHKVDENSQGLDEAGSSVIDMENDKSEGLSILM